MFKRIGISGEKALERTLSYSPWAIGMRSPYSPTGLVFRETGQADLYSGLSRVILGSNGNSVILGDLLGIRVSRLVIKTPNIEDITFSKGHFTSKLESYPKLLKPKVDLKGLYVLGPESFIQVDPSSGLGTVVNPVQLLDILEEITIFSPVVREAYLKDNHIFSEVKNLI